MWTIVGPLLIELAKEWVRKGKPSKENVKATAEAVLSQFENISVADLDTLGKNMVIQGLAFQEMAKVLKPSDGNIPALRKPGQE